MSAFYERHPYPPPVDDLERYRTIVDDDRRRADVPSASGRHEPYRDDRSILVAGCGTSQAARYALRWPRAQVVGIDVSATSIEFTERLKRKYGLDNLELRQLPVERAAELGRTFDHVVCTGVLHHLPDPDAGLRALRDVLAPDGALHLMVYAPYGRAGVYLLQDYCRRLGIGTTTQEIRRSRQSLQALPPDHPLMPLLRNSPDFGDEAGLADALLHPQDRAYSVPQLLEFLRARRLDVRALDATGALPAAVRRAGVDAASPAAGPAAAGGAIRRRRTLPRDRWCATAPWRTATTGRLDAPIDFDGDAWLDYVPMRVPDTIMVRERLPPGAAAVLINRHHTYTDLYLPIDRAAKGAGRCHRRKTIHRRDRAGNSLRHVARVLFEGLWWYDQVVFDASRTRPGRSA